MSGSTPLPITPPVAPLEAARQQTAVRAARLAAGGLSLYAQPPEPATCCGRGCNGCVWEGWYAAVAYWCEQADALLDNGAS